MTGATNSRFSTWNEWFSHVLPHSCWERGGTAHLPDPHERDGDSCDRSCVHKGRCATRRYEARGDWRPRTLSGAQRVETGGPIR
jgi:hypothetical protein